MSDEVSQFLEQVEKLRGQQIEEDEERAREMEEYLAAKRERQARRQERARSISPQKSSPFHTPSPRSSRQSVRLNDPPRLDTPTATPEYYHNHSPTRQDSHAMRQSSSPTKEHSTATDAAATLTRDSSALSWQRRSPSRGPGGGRPMSMFVPQTSSHRSLPEPQQEPQSAVEPTLSRDQIAQSLGSKDPGWFRQTADRGAASAAYRKNQVEDENRSQASTLRAQLPGMTVNTDLRAERENSHPHSAARVLTSPMPLNPPHDDGYVEDEGKNDSEALIKSPGGRTSPNRATSPTKGMGGFVQSAMMKRSDSVKRWSVQSPPSLARVDAVGSNRSSMYIREPPTATRPPSMARIGSVTPTSSRPVSYVEKRSSSNETAPKVAAAASSPTEDPAPIPTSPSRTMDPRRWSPTKSSWLDSALNKPDSPKPELKPHTPTQPAWMTELNKKKNNPSADLTSSTSHKHQVSIGGLMRSSPMGAAAKTNTTGLGGIYSPPVGGNRPPLGHGSRGSISIGSRTPSPSKTEQREAMGREATEPVVVKTEDVAKQQMAALKSAEVSPTPISKAEPKVDPPKGEPSKNEFPKKEPPKNDFRANLKQRHVDSGPPKADEPEFKNVFGNLRKAKTQNYVAPDELKSNIMRGKASLAATGGPQKSEHKDEFKEAILQKKSSFRKAQEEGRGIVRTPSTDTDKPVPEGLAKRAELGKLPASAKREPSANRGALADAPSELAPRALPGLGRVGGGKLADRFNPALAGMIARGPPPITSEGGKGSDNSASSTGRGSDEPSKPGPALTHMTKGRARGPKRKAPTTMAVSQQSTSRPSEEEQPTPTATTTRALEPSPMTESIEKNAAPTVQAQAAATAAFRSRTTDQGPRGQQTRPSPFHRLTNSESTVGSKNQKSSEGANSVESTSPTKLNIDRIPRLGAEEHSSSQVKTEPVKHVHQRTGSRPPVDLSQHQLPPPSSPARNPERQGLDNSPSTVSEHPSPSEPLIPEPEPPVEAVTEPVTSVKSATSRSDPVATKPQSPPPGPKPNFDSIGSRALPPTPVSQPKPARPLPTPSLSNQVPSSSTQQHKDRSNTNTVLPVSKSPNKPTDDLSNLLTDFFGPKRPRQDYNIDTSQIIAQRPDGDGKIKSLGCRIFQISGDGKKTPVLSHYERTLFEREMYIVSHEFKDINGRKTAEVYFWLGDDVPESTSQDAQVFVNMEARAFGGKLIRLHQGRETSRFLQALGGTVTTRRGSSNKYDSLAPAILCGRRHFEQVVFDEVDFTPSSLCSGFPYLITQNGKCHLWKGKGSSVDEIGCARLVGMDLTLTGELYEHEEGSESDSFWDMFASKDKPHSADHWRLKPGYARYCSRLFRSDAQAKEQILELTPFSQSDILPQHIYILDAFFEMYIIVGANAQSQFPSFRNALNFAQEYAILVASMEDRPFVPVSTVVLEGAPRDMRRCFRKWAEQQQQPVGGSGIVSGGGMAYGGSGSAMGGGLRRGRSLRVVTLGQALQALD